MRLPTAIRRRRLRRLQPGRGIGLQKAIDRVPPTSEPDGIACASVARVLLVAVLVGILSCSSCGTAPARTASPRPSVSISSEAQQAIAQARADAASRTGVEADSWRAVEVTARQWPDAGLGCPEPGKLYAQVLTPGYLITLEAGSRRLVYHSGAGRVVYCNG